MRWLQNLLMKVYGTSREDENERVRATAEAVAERAREREEELGTQSVHYSRSVLDAYGGAYGRGDLGNGDGS